MDSAGEWAARPRRYLGLMSGTSLDGIDAVVIEVDGAIPIRSMHMLAFLTYPYTPPQRARLASLMNAEAPLREVTKANMWLGELFAEAAFEAVAQAGLDCGDIDAIASHGQTIWHIPPQRGEAGATMQIGEASVIAERTGVMTVADFRPRDMAAGGQGAPLTPFADYLLFNRFDRPLAIQNIGGIANVTYLDGADIGNLLAFDTGPGNMVIDAVVSQFGYGNYDEDGKIAATGCVCLDFLKELLAHDYYLQQPPKSTGRELFGDAYANEVIARARAHRLPPCDVVATITALTAESIARAYRDFLPSLPQEVVLGGGGSHNPVLCTMLAERLPGISVVTHEAYGINSDAKEAIAFALLAHATLCHAPANIPAVTGARRPVILGKIIPGHVQKA